MFQALADAEISIQTSSTSEIVIGCVVARADGEHALQKIHEAFELDQDPPDPNHAQ